MAAKHKMTVSTQPMSRRPSGAERRAAQAESLANRQAELKQEAAARRGERAGKSSAGAPTTRTV